MSYARVHVGQPSPSAPLHNFILLYPRTASGKCIQDLYKYCINTDSGTLSCSMISVLPYVHFMCNMVCSYFWCSIAYKTHSCIHHSISPLFILNCKPFSCSKLVTSYWLSIQAVTQVGAISWGETLKMTLKFWTNSHWLQLVQREVHWSLGQVLWTDRELDFVSLVLAKAGEIWFT